MTTAVRLKYPSITTSSSFSSKFIDFGNKFVYRKYQKKYGFVNLCFKPEIISTEEPNPTFSSIQISNNADFESYKEIDVSGLDLTHNSYWYEFETNFTTGVVSMSGFGVVGATQPSNEHFQLLSSEIIVGASQSNGVHFIRGWPLSVSEGEKSVYIRFVLSDGDTYPDPSSIIAKGFYDSIIWEKSLPSTPGQPIALNSTDNDYVGDEIFLTYTKSQNHVSDINGYSINLRKIGDQSFSQNFENDNDIIILGSHLISQEEASDIESAGRIVSIYRHEGATIGGGLTEIADPFTGIKIDTRDDGVGDWEGYELSTYTSTSGRSSTARFKFRFSGTDVIEEYDESSPPVKDQQYFVVFKNFSDVYKSDDSGNALLFDVDVDSNSGAGAILFEIPVYSTNLPVVAPSSYPTMVDADFYSDSLFVDYDSIEANISAASLPGVASDRSYTMVSFSKQNVIRISTNNWGGSQYEKIYSVDSIPESGTIEVVYEDNQNVYELETDSNFYMTDIGDASSQKFISQSFRVSKRTTGVNKINLKLKDLGSGGDTTYKIGAIIVETNDIGDPVNINREPNIYAWDEVDTAIGIVFDQQILTANGQEFDLLLTTNSSDATLETGKMYLLILAIQTNNSGNSKIGTQLTTWNNISNFERYVYFARNVHSGFANTSWATGGMKITKVDHIVASNPSKMIAFDFLDSLDNLLWSSYRDDERARISVFLTKEQEFSSEMLITAEVNPMVGNYRGITIGHRHKQTSSPTLSYIDSLSIDNSLIISNIQVQKPEDISGDDIVIGNPIFNGVPVISGYSKWKNYLTGYSFSDEYSDNISEVSNKFDDFIFFEGLNPSKIQLSLQSGLFSSSNIFPDSGGQPDFASNGIEGWVGKDLYFSEPCLDDSVHIESEYSLENIKDYDESEIYFLISSQEVYTNVPDIYRNYVKSLGIPEDFIRISISSLGELKLYRNGSDQIEIESKLANGLPTKGLIKIEVLNEDENYTNINVYISDKIDNVVVYKNIVNNILIEKFVPSTPLGFYLVIGNRVKNNEREDSYLTISNMKLVINNTDILSIENEDNLYLYDELNGVELSDRINIYPDISDNSNDGEYFDRESHKYIKANNNTNSKKYLLSTLNGYVLGDREINWCDQVLQNDNVKCWGLLMSNTADNLRALGEPQRCVEASESSGNVGRDFSPPIGDRRSYFGPYAISRVSTDSDQKKFSLFVNARSFSRNQYVCSEWQWYEAQSPWSAEQEWIGNLVSDAPINRRSSRPSQVDQLTSTNYSLKFDYSFASDTIDDNFEIYFGISNFKPSYRTFNKSGNNITLSIKDVNITNPGSGYVSPPSVIFISSESPSTIATGSVEIESGMVKNVVISNEGAGYSEDTKVVFQGGTFDSVNGVTAQGKVVLGAPAGSSSENIRYSVSTTNNKWIYSIHDFEGKVSGNLSHDHYDPDLSSVGFVYGEELSYSNSSDILGVKGYEGQSLHEDIDAASYHILLPYQRVNSASAAVRNIQPIDISKRGYMQVSISNTNKVKVSYVKNRNSWSAKTDQDNKIINDIEIEIPSDGIIEMKIERSSRTINDAIDASTGMIVENYTPENDIDILSIYHGEGDNKNRLAQIYCPSLYDAEYFNYLYPFFGIREKTNFGIFESLIGNVEITTIDARSIMPLNSDEVSWWIKKDGNLDDQDAIYGRNLLEEQIYSDDDSQVLTANSPHISQSFMFSETNESFSDNSYVIPWNNQVEVSCISIQIESSTDTTEWRCIIVADDAGQPDIGISGSNVDINQISEENWYRPTTDIDISDSNILGISYAKNVSNSNFIYFLFSPPVILSDETKYWFVITHPSLSSSYNSLISSSYANVYVWSNDSTALPQRKIKIGENVEDVAKKVVLDDVSKIWNVISNQWESIDRSVWHRIFRDKYFNIRNLINNDQYSIRSSGNSISGDLSHYSRESKNFRTDINPPWDPGTLLSPTLSVDAFPGVLNQHNLTISADDTDINGLGSGIWRFRVVYYDDDGIQKYGVWNNWIDQDADDQMVYSWTYPGNKIDNKQVFIQIQDKVGNISISNSIEIENEYGFIIDTTPPYFSRVRLEGDATIENDPSEAEYTPKRRVNLSMYALDATTDIKDFRINKNYEENSDGSLIYSSFMPISPNIIQDLGIDDGNKFISVQFRDYANNADQAIIEQTIGKNFEDASEIPLAHQAYAVSGREFLYISTLSTKIRNGLIGISKSVEGYSSYMVYYFIDDNKIVQDINSNETIEVYVNSILQEVNIDYVLNYNLNYVIFTSSLLPSDEVEINSEELVCNLYRFDGTISDKVYEFNIESEQICTSMIVYNNILFLGFNSGNIYSYNGNVITKQFTLTNALGEEIPVGTMNKFQFSFETREYLYVGSYDEARMWRFGGNNSIQEYSWNLLDEINDFTTIINGSEFNFDDQSDVYSIEGYNDKLYIGTGNNSAIFNYYRYLDSDGITILEEVGINKLSDISSDFSGDKVSALRTFNDVIFAGTDSASIFYYKKSDISQPRLSQWDDLIYFDSIFLNDFLPWKYYETPGRTDPNFSNNISIINETNDSDNILSSAMQISGSISDIVVFINDSNVSSWVSNANNSIGWTIEFEARLQPGIDDYGKQGISVYDGSYFLNFSFDDEKLYINNGIDDDLIEINFFDIETDNKIVNYIWKEDFTNSDNISGEELDLLNVDNKIRFYGIDYSIESNFARLKIRDTEYPYIEVVGFENIFATKDTLFEIKIKVHSFKYDEVKLYFQWSDKNNGPFIKERTYTLSISNNNIWKEFSFNPGWSGAIKSIRILIEPTENARLDIDYIYIQSSVIASFDVFEMNKYRITSQNNDINVYVNDINQNIFNFTNLLSIETSNKSIIFGKIDQAEIDSKVLWNNIKIYTGGALSPYEEQSVEWKLLNKFSIGDSIQSMQIVRNNLIAIVNPSDSILETDDSNIYPITYIMKNSFIWENLDSEYIAVSNVLYSSVWNNSLYSSGGLFVDNSNSTSSIDDIYSLMIRKDDETIPNSGNLYARKLTHSWDSIIKDSNPPETNLIIKDNEDSGGIDVYELNIYIKED